MNDLHAARFQNASSANMLEWYESPARIGVRCSLPGWLQRMEVTVLKRSIRDSWITYQDHIGQRLALIDGYAEVILDGWVYEVVPDGKHLHIIAAGAWKRLTDEYETNNPSAGTDVVSDYIKNTVLANHAPALSTTTDNIDSMGTQIGATFAVDSDTGDTVQDIIKTLLDWSSSNDDVWDFWAQSQPLSGAVLELPLPYLKAQSTSASVNWQFDRTDLVDLMMSRHIWELANDVTVYYGSTPTATSAETDSTSQTDFWTSENKPLQALMTQTPAEQYRGAQLTTFKNPVQQASFIIGSRWARSGLGNRWPLWRLLRAPGYLRINDLEPDSAVLNTSKDSESVFWTMALDYDHELRQMLVTPDQPSSRLDAVLQRETNVAEFRGEMIQRGRRHRPLPALPMTRLS